MTPLLTHVVIWLLRLAGSFLDGYNGRHVPWWNFHVANWLRRDVPMLVLYWSLWGWPWGMYFKWWIGVGALHFVAHHVMLRLGRKLFRERRKHA